MPRIVDFLERVIGQRERETQFFKGTSITICGKRFHRHTIHNVNKLLLSPKRRRTARQLMRQGNYKQLIVSVVRVGCFLNTVIEI